MKKKVLAMMLVSALAVSLTGCELTRIDTQDTPTDPVVTDTSEGTENEQDTQTENAQATETENAQGTETPTEESFTIAEEQATHLARRNYYEESTVFSEQYFDEEERLVRELLYDGSWLTYEYEEGVNDDGDLTVTTRTYDDYGALLNTSTIGYFDNKETIHTRTYSDAMGSYTFVYDRYGHQISYTDSAGTKSMSDVYFEDGAMVIEGPDGTVTRYVVEDDILISDTVVTSFNTVETKYNADGDVLYLAYYDENGELTNAFSYSYDEAGNNTESINYFRNWDGGDNWYLYSYVYDEDNRLMSGETKYRTSMEDEWEVISSSRNEYDEQGRLISTVYEEGDGYEDLYFYEYVWEGTTLTETNYYNGEIYSVQKKEYDAHGV